MEDHTKNIELLIEKATEYLKISYELIKLKTIDKTSDVVSSLTHRFVFFVLIASFMLFLNLGLSFWLGKILGNTFYGFFIIAAFYFIAGIIFHFFMHKWIKKIINNYIIKQVLK